MNHVAFVIPGVDRLGGAERQVLLLSAGLVRRGWRVSVVALTGAGGEAAENLRGAGVEFLSLHMRRGVADPRGWIPLRRRIRDNRVDILHAHLPHASWMARGVRMLAPVRAVVDTIHTSARVKPLQRVVYRMSGGLSDRVTAVSDAVANTCSAQGLASAERMAVISNGIDTTMWRPDGDVRERVRAELGLVDEFLWCSVGRLEPVKDQALLLRAFAALPPGSRLVIAGAGWMEASLRALANALRIEGRVKFLGFQADVRRWVQAADGFALTSRWEGHPLSLLECAACGVPCVATDVAGVRDVVQDGVTGFVAAAGAEDAVRDQMMRLIGMRAEERLAIGLRARRHVVEHFDMDAVLDRWENLYGELLAANPVPRRFARSVGQAAVSAPAVSAQ